MRAVSRRLLPPGSTRRKSPVLRLTFMLSALAGCLIAPAARAATNITVIATGTGNLDSFLSAADGTITVADDPGDTTATLSKAALEGVGSGVPISIAADNTIGFQDVVTLNLQTGFGFGAVFQTATGSIAFLNPLNTVSTTGGSIQFTAGTNLTVCNLNSMGGDVSLAAGTAGAGNIGFGTILTSNSGNLTFQATNAAGGTIAQSGTAAASGLSITAVAKGNVIVNSLRGTSVTVTSNSGSITSTGASPIQAAAQLTLLSATGIAVNTSASSLQAVNSTAGNISIIQTASPAQTLTITGSGVSNSVSGAAVSISNLGSGIVINGGATVATNNGALTLAATDLQLNGTVNSGTATTTLANSIAGTQIDVGTNTPGKIGLIQAELNTVTAGVLHIGNPTAGSINVSAPITTPAGWNKLALINGSTITEAAAGSLTLANLRVSSVGPVTLTSSNNTGALAASTAGAFTFSNGAHALIVGTVDGVLGVSTTNSDITLTADFQDIQQPVSAGSGTVTLQPNTSNFQINLGGADAPGIFGLSDTELSRVTAGVLRVGSLADTNGIIVSSAITRHPGYSTLSLLNGGSITQTASLSVANLALKFAGTGTLTAITNDVDNLAAQFANLGYTDANSVTIAAIDGISGVSCGSALLLMSGGSVTQNSGANLIAGSAIELSGAGPFTLNNPGNSTPLIAANVSGDVAYTNAGNLTVGSLLVSGVFSNGSVTVSTVAGDLTVAANVISVSTSISLTAGGSDHLLTNGSQIDGNTDVTLTADRMALGGTIVASTAELQPFSGRPVNIDNTAGNPNGELRLSVTELNTITANILRVGDLSNTGNLTVKTPLANGTGWTTLSLFTSASGGISQTAAITVTNLQTTAGANGVTLQNGSNAVAKVAGESFGGFSLITSSNLFVATVDGSLGILASGPISLTLTAALGLLTTNQPIQTTLGSTGANINLIANTMNVTAAVNGGSSGIVSLLPALNSRTISLGGTNTPSQLGISNALLTNVTGKIVRVGSSSQTGVISLDGNITRHAGYNTLTLTATGAGGAIVQGPGSISVANLALAAAAGIGSATNIPVIGPINVAFHNTTSGAVRIASTGAMTIAAVDSLATSDNAAPATLTVLSAAGPLTFAVNTTSNGNLGATTTETASETTTPLPEPDEDVIVASGVTVRSTGGSVVITSADKIDLRPGAVVMGFAGSVSFQSGVGDNDNDSAFPPVIAKMFNASSIPLNVSTSLQFTITNPNVGGSLLGVGFTDNLPAGLVVASPNALSSNCSGGTATAVAGSGTITLAGAFVGSSASCTVLLNVTGKGAGTKNNVTGNVSSANGGPGNTAMATIGVVAPPSIATAFNPNSIGLNATTSLNFAITSPPANDVSLSGVTFNNTLPPGLTVANSSAPTCGGTLTTTAPNGIALSGASIAVNGQCLFSVTVTATSLGTFINTTTVGSANGGTGNTAVASLHVSTCPFSLSSPGIPAPAVGMSGTFNVTTPGSCAWTAVSDSAWLTTSSTGTGSGPVAFDVAQNVSTIGRSGKITVGDQTFTVTQSGVSVSNLVATATATPSVTLTWSSSTVDHFEVYRNSGSGFVLINTSTTTSYNDNDSLAIFANSAYVYKVRAVDSGANPSADSNLDLATTFSFTDDPLVAGGTLIKEVHVVELRQAVNIVRGLAGLGTFSFTDGSLAGSTLKLIHVTQLRDALDPARSTLGLAPATYGNISAGTVIGASDLTELRNGVK